MEDIKFNNPFTQDIDKAVATTDQFKSVNGGTPKPSMQSLIGSFRESLATTPSAIEVSGAPKAFYGDSDMNLTFDRYYSHPSFSELGYSPWRDNESLYNANSGWTDDLRRGLKATGSIIGSTMWNNKPFLSTLDLFDPLNYEEEHASELSRLMKVGTSTRGGVGGFATNFFVNSGITLGIAASAVIESMAIGAMFGSSAGPQGTAGGTALGTGVGLFRSAQKLGSALGKMLGVKPVNLLRNVVDNPQSMKSLYAFSKNPIVDFINPLSNLTELATDAPKTFKGLDAL